MAPSKKKCELDVCVQGCILMHSPIPLRTPLYKQFFENFDPTPIFPSSAFIILLQ